MPLHIHADDDACPDLSARFRRISRVLPEPLWNPGSNRAEPETPAASASRATNRTQRHPVARRS